VETISNMKNILAVATVDESFPQDFSIYNLPEFLGATSLLSDPEFTFGDASLTVADDRIRSLTPRTLAAFCNSERSVELISMSISASGIVIIFSGEVTIPSLA
jgi:hypothetical protein